MRSYQRGRYVGAALSETPVTSMNSPGEAPMLPETYTSYTISEKIFRYGKVNFHSAGDLLQLGTERLRRAYYFR
jgi:hypothetical protein